MDSSAATEATEAELAFQRAEFLAEDELIEINPMVKSDVITLMRGEFGPFEPSITTTVCFTLNLSTATGISVIPMQKGQRTNPLSGHLFC